VVDFARYLTRNQNGEIIFNFGKHKGKPITEELDYVRWMLEGEFPEATKMVIRQAIGAVLEP
jgi:DNA polymerase-3 subunit epsilon